jgi:hypothetical protein
MSAALIPARKVSRALDRTWRDLTMRLKLVDVDDETLRLKHVSTNSMQVTIMSVANLFVVAAGHWRRHGALNEVFDGCDEDLDLVDERLMNALMDVYWNRREEEREPQMFYTGGLEKMEGSKGGRREPGWTSPLGACAPDRPDLSLRRACDI